MAQERDERWTYVALAVLIVAYVVYRYRGSIDFSKLSLPLGRLKPLGATVPYVLASVFGVLFQLWNRRRIAALRQRLEDSLRFEGLVRQGPDVQILFGGGARGSLRADVYLTRAALYVFDKGGRRDPMRIPLERGSPVGPSVVDAVLVPKDSAGGQLVRIVVGGRTGFSIEFAGPDAGGWWADIRKALGKSSDAEAYLEEREREDREAVAPVRGAPYGWGTKRESSEDLLG